MASLMGDDNILVTGATGFIGSALFKRLRVDGYRVDGLSLHGGAVDGEGIAPVDTASEKALNDYAQGRTYKAIFHIAACIPATYTSQESESCFYPNVQSVRNVLNLASKMQGCQVIYASGTAVYGKNRAFPLDESSSCFPDNYYTLSKYVGELLCHLYEDRFPVSILRISSPYGPGYKRQTVVNIFCRQAVVSGDLKIYGSGARSQDFVYIDDIIDACMLALERRSAGVYNICSAKATSMRDLAEVVLSLTRSSASKIMDSGLPDPQEDFRASYSNDNAASVLGFVPRVSVQEGLVKTLAWWESQL
jgi:UDP-glucose 4-epimerase